MALFGGKDQQKFEPVKGPSVEEFQAQQRKGADFKPIIGKGQGKIIKAKLLGIRMAQETKVISTVNSSSYCFLVEYESGLREVLEMGADDKRFSTLLYFIEM